MITLLSPAKTLDFDSKITEVSSTMPLFIAESETIMKKLLTLSKKKLSLLMDINSELASLNVERYQQWMPDFTTDASRPAVLAFSGEVYRGLQAGTFSEAELKYSQDHLRILSGLHGILRPLDRILPHRLEMGTTISIGRKKNLYEYWKLQVTEALNKDIAASGSEFVVNLASSEYAKVVDWKKVKARVITPVFKELKGADYKVVMTYAKHARGEMAKYMVQHRINDPEGLKGFSSYQFMEKLSSEGEWVFAREASKSK